MKGAAEETDAVQLAAYFHSLYQKFHLKKHERKQVQRKDKVHRPKSRQRTKSLLVSRVTKYYEYYDLMFLSNYF